MNKAILITLTLSLLSCRQSKTIIEDNTFNIPQNENPSSALKVTQLDPSEAYYGADFNDLENKTLNEKTLIKKLVTILNGIHQRTTSEDKIVQSCPANEKCYKYNPYTYRDVRKFLFGKLYLKTINGEYTVTDTYCDHVIKNKDKVNGQDVVLGPDFYPSGNIINTEHLWPQSRFHQFKNEAAKNYTDNDKKNDLHHLMPTDPEVNSLRAAFPFGEVESSETPLSCQSSIMGKGEGVKYSTKDDSFFEPPQRIKGDIARALMYMSIRYEMYINDKQESFLRQWHKADPVDQDEARRNNLIHKYQGTRNPFIDFPHLVDSISDF